MESQPTRVLVVDDDPAFAQVMADLLMEKGFHVVATDDPDRALKTRRGRAATSPSSTS